MIPQPPPSFFPSTNVMLPECWQVVENRWETHDTFTLRLQPPASSLQPKAWFLPGQFNMLYAFGTGESAISISGDPAHPGELIHTIRRVGIVTEALSRLEPGDSLGVRGPFGSAWPVEEMRGHDVVFLAGGIGLAPLRPAIYHVLANRPDYGKVVILLGARTPADIIFAAELESWIATSGIEVHLTVDRSGDGWNQHVGVVTNLIPRAGFDPDRAVAMICGPEIMMRYSILALNQRGVADERIFVTMERNMKCAVGFCGHCQFGPEFICRDGPVFRYDRLKPWFLQREL